ncbi:predicted protein [Plenodomus lingam JN3]|uniref:Predicted protein n=1 Tax=Leptosphaeria maculans (strain JN3 / isolate v23.1.3 / race Av1-4-5-6-7-8) TaxID=985895 RepID=E4ZVE1_LEPMJ|nr:predicted protein [Plenodomus lingam JN3]CBX95567.1 predicted protein [Plenodomus lingam JN3]
MQACPMSCLSETTGKAKDRIVHSPSRGIRVLCTRPAAGHTDGKENSKEYTDINYIMAM